MLSTALFLITLATPKAEVIDVVAQTPPPETPAGARRDGLPTDVVDKLSSDQLKDVLDARSPIYSKEIVDKLGPDQLADVLKTRENSRNAFDPQAVLVPLGFFVSLGVTVVFALFLRHRKDAERQQTLRLMIEKGVTIPPDLITPPERRRSDLRRGVVLLALGAGLSLMLAMIDTGDAGGVWSIGLIPGLVGAGYLLVWKLENGRSAA
jgi:hypothetical protein